MALKDLLPDRPLTLDEFQKLQAQDAFDSVMTTDSPHGMDVLFLKKGETEHTLHYSDESGWHRCDSRSLE